MGHLVWGQSSVTGLAAFSVINLRRIETSRQSWHRRIDSVQRGGEKNPEKGHPSSSVVRRDGQHPTGSDVIEKGTPQDFRRKRGINRMKSPDIGRGHPTSSDVSVSNLLLRLVGKRDD